MKLRMMSLVVASGLAVPALAFQTGQVPSNVDSMKAEMAKQELADQVKAAGKAPTPTFNDTEIKAAAELLTGQWKTSAPVDGDAGAKIDLVMGIAPVVVQGLSNTLYCEVSRADQMRVPIRQTILSMSKVNGKIRLTTFEYRRSRGQLPSAYSMWAAPEAFPWEVGADDLIATLSLDLTSTGGKLTGKTPHAYPTGLGGAIEMTSEISVTKDAFEVADRGLSSTGAQAWGPAAGSFTKFTRADLGLKVVHGEEGLISITYPSKLEGNVAVKDEQISADYIAYLMDGRSFDSTFERQKVFVFPQGAPLLEGWNKQMADTQKGLVRRLVIPPKFGYGEQGRRGKIPPNATLIYDIEIKDVAPPPPPPPPPAPAPAPANEKEQPDGSGQAPH